MQITLSKRQKDQKDKISSDCVRTFAIDTTMLIKTCLAYNNLSFCSNLCLVGNITYLKHRFSKSDFNLLVFFIDFGQIATESSPATVPII